MVADRPRGAGGLTCRRATCAGASHASSQWPYTVIGVGFALYGLVLVTNGTLRARKVEACLSRGDQIPPQGGLITVVSVAGVLLSLATGALIIAQ